MPDPNAHIPKKQLIEFINTNLFVDDMIAIDRHLETCDKCTKQYNKLKKRSTMPAHSLTLKQMYILVATLVVIILAVVGYFIGSGSPTAENEQNKEVLSATSLSNDSSVNYIPVEGDTNITQTPVEITPQEHEINQGQDDTSTNHTEVIPSPIIESNQPEDNTVDPQDNLEENIPVVQENPEEVTANEVTNTPNEPMAVEEDDRPNSFSFKVNPTNIKSASPVNGYNSFSKYLLSSLDHLILPINGIEKTPLIISFEIQEDKSLSNFKTVSTTNQMYAESMIEVIKNGPEWQIYESQQDSNLIINQAEISINIVN